MLANTTVTVYRGTTTSDLGDEEDADTPIAIEVPLWIKEMSKTVVRGDGQTPQIVRWYTGRATSGANIQAHDRLLDEKTGRRYLVDSTSPDDSGIGGRRSDLKICLRALSPNP